MFLYTHHFSDLFSGPAIRRFFSHEKGSTAVEFALVGLPFFALLIALVEMAVVFFVNVALEAHVQDAVRLIKTGQAQTAGMTNTDFKNAVCNNFGGMFSCATRLHVDVRRYDSFSQVNEPDIYDDAQELDEDKLAFNPGAGGDIVVTRAFYNWPVFSLITMGASGNAATGRTLTTTFAFRNEPF